MCESESTSPLKRRRLGFIDVYTPGLHTGLTSCMTVEVAELGSPSLIALMASVDVL